MSTYYPTYETNGPRDRRALRAVAVAVGLFVVGVLANLVLSLAVAVPLLLAGVAVTSAAGLVLLTLAGDIGFAAVGVAYLRRWLSGVPVRRLTRSDARVVGVYTLVVLLVATVFTALSAVLDIEPATSVVGDIAASSPWVLLAFAALSVLVVAPAEELLFRGAIQGRLRRAFGPVAAVVGAGLLFAALHVLNFGALNAGAAVALGVIFVVGAVLGWAYERTDNLVVPVAIHGAYNAVLFGATYSRTRSPERSAIRFAFSILVGSATSSRLSPPKQPSERRGASPPSRSSVRDQITSPYPALSLI